MSFVDNDYLTVREYVGFSYTDFLTQIFFFLDGADFLTREYETPQFKDGGTDWDVIMVKYSLTDSLSAVQIEELRDVLKDGFAENWNIVKIRQEILDRVGVEDLVLDNGAVLSADIRAGIIARTEVVRATNQGLLSMFAEDDINDVQWIASFGDRTCDYCDDMNGEIMSLDDADEMIPAHSSCRCTWAPIRG